MFKKKTLKEKEAELAILKAEAKAFAKEEAVEAEMAELKKKKFSRSLGGKALKGFKQFGKAMKKQSKKSSEKWFSEDKKQQEGLFS